MGVVNQSVKDSVAQGGVADDLVPFLDGQLAGNQGRAQVVAILQDLQDVPALLVGEVGQSPVVNDEEIDACIGRQELPVAPVGPAQGQFVKELGCPRVDGPVAFAAGLVSREARATRARHIIRDQFGSKQQIFLDFVLTHYVNEGVDELDQEKLNPLLRLKYHNSLADAIENLGRADEIGRTFAGFQKYLYQTRNIM